MLWLYNFGIFFYGLLINAFAQFNPKAKLFVEGRKNLFPQISKKIISGDRTIWFHFASLGEFEQGRPVLERIKKQYYNKKIVITFFSPSGYEIRKNTPLADAVFYLPMDTPSNAKKFIDLVNPELVIFTKYEYWHNYFRILHERSVPLFMISAIFRPSQVFFKWYGRFNRKTLSYVTHFFVQNQESKLLLENIGIKNISLSGDTRFDTVTLNTEKSAPNNSIEAFIAAAPTLIAGSTWPADETLLSQLIKKQPDWKLIIAPHEIDPGHIDQIQMLFPQAVKYSALPKHQTHSAQVLIIDNIGLLSSLYQYGLVSYIGGGFGAGIHNTLEAAAFALPVIFGPNYQKFQEAKDLIALKAANSVQNIEELAQAFEIYANDTKYGVIAKSYVSKKTGATNGILQAVEKFLG
ncbi:3-deoxy-D-manno-octulosonic acid transferase [Pedobacter sp. MC2016-14]|uniref:3-deoxy-D-manno-octulosonic acid transferase n=1 Tax=Pedobacter sp. MC2016-14 TaxID=2897327 RepID=UPI001E5280C5|nr:glycosyltransferase N-terminal domain-containing protein [Pedobacter sp. MC2016-14]MCD0486609.1 3-deoxy-D-manno-octulosonic acid transferase [Pedobacter sp. MC2016-14]